MNDSNFDTSPKRGIWFYIFLAIAAIFILMSFNVDYIEFQKNKEIPSWYFVIILIVNILTTISFIAIIFYRKLGVFLLPFFVLVHYVLHHFYLSTILYSDLFALFYFVGFGLLVIIPKWKFFK